MSTHTNVRRLAITLAAAATVAAGCGRQTSADRPVPMRSPTSSTVATTAAPTTQPSPSPTTPLPSTSAPTVAPTTTLATRPTHERPTADRDETVDVDGAQVHLRCTGRGAATVVLINGFESGSDVWDAVVATVSAAARVCTFDRPGTGESGPPNEIQTFATQATTLRHLLDAAGEPGPLVLVGHSFGGAVAVTYASMFADAVVGLALVDASPPEWPGALCAVADDGSAAPSVIGALCDSWADPHGNDEQLDVSTAFAEAGALPSLGDLPLVVLTAVDRQLPDGIAEAERARLTDAWDRGQQWWAGLSSASRIVPVAGTGHFVQLDRPDLVAAEIVRLLP